MSFLRATSVTVAIIEEAVVNLKRWQLMDRELDSGGISREGPAAAWLDQ